MGASGVGKTQILRAILKLKKISRGASLNGLKWHIKFSTQKDHTYEWQGGFENKGFLQGLVSEFESEEDEKDLPTIEYEKLFIDENLVIDRTQNGILFNGAKTVKLSQTESVISLLKEEQQIKNVYQEFGRILFDDYSRNHSEMETGWIRFFLDRDIDVKLKKFTTLESIRNSDESLKTKLYLSYKNERQIFDEIKDTFIDVFPYVEDIKVEPLNKSNDNEKLHPLLREAPFIQIKEKGVHNWIEERKMSSGMFRALMHISEIHLCAYGTLILIDEFENSLGINCIDEVTRCIVSNRRNLQFIITSHHPYIINNINLKNWKLITRKAGVVKSYDATKFITGESKHKAFTQLINLDEYLEGVAE